MISDRSSCVNCCVENRPCKQAGNQDTQDIATESHGINMQELELLFAISVTLLLHYMDVCNLKFRYSVKSSRKKKLRKTSLYNAKIT